MNFLLHRHFATRESGDARVGFGAMLPDLVRLVDRRWRPRAPDITARATGVRAGIAHHFAADAWFHRTRTFRDGEARTAAALRDLAHESPRLGLFAHVTWELCLDGAWLRQGGADDEIAALRDDVARYAAEANEALREERGAPVDDAVARRLSVLWSRVPDLAAGYAVGAGVARRLDGMRRALGLPEASEDVLERWSSVLEERIDDAAASLGPLDAERQLALAPAPKASAARS